MAFLLAAFAFLNASSVDNFDYETQYTSFETTPFPAFSEWMSVYGRTYSGLTELMFRRDTYEANLNKIEEHNSGNHAWTMGVNKFADLTANEFKARYTGGYSGAKKESIDSLYIQNANHMKDRMPNNI